MWSNGFLHKLSLKPLSRPCRLISVLPCAGSAPLSELFFKNICPLSLRLMDRSYLMY